jgi:hypothetical protein
MDLLIKSRRVFFDEEVWSSMGCRLKFVVPSSFTIIKEIYINNHKGDFNSAEVRPIICLL